MIDTKTNLEEELERLRAELALKIVIENYFNVVLKVEVAQVDINHHGRVEGFICTCRSLP